MKPAGEFSVLCWGTESCESFFNGINFALRRKKKNPVFHEILIQVASISILEFCFFKLIRFKENIFSVFGPPNTEQSCSESCLSASFLPKLLETYFPLSLIIPSLEMNCSGARIWQWEHSDLAGIVRAGFLQRLFRELFYSLPKFVSQLSSYSVFLFK